MLGSGLLLAGLLPASTAEAAATVNKGDTTWMLIATILVILMTIPGLALFYGGLVRSKNVLSVLTQVFLCFSMIAILWVIYGYSVAFTTGMAQKPRLRTIPAPDWLSSKRPATASSSRATSRSSCWG